MSYLLIVAKPGRPPQSGETRDMYIQVRASLSEKAVWLLAAEIAHRDFSPFSREVLNEKSREVLGLCGRSTTISHLADLLGRDEESVRQAAILGDESIGPGGRISSDFALGQIACDANPDTAAPSPWAQQHHREK